MISGLKKGALIQVRSRRYGDQWLDATVQSFTSTWVSVRLDNGEGLTIKDVNRVRLLFDDLKDHAQRINTLRELASLAYDSFDPVQRLELLDRLCDSVRSLPKASTVQAALISVDALSGLAIAAYAEEKAAKLSGEHRRAHAINIHLKVAQQAIQEAYSRSEVQ